MVCMELHRLDNGWATELNWKESVKICSYCGDFLLYLLFNLIFFFASCILRVRVILMHIHDWYVFWWIEPVFNYEMLFSISDNILSSYSTLYLLLLLTLSFYTYFCLVYIFSFIFFLFSYFRMFFFWDLKLGHTFNLFW